MHEGLPNLSSSLDYSKYEQDIAKTEEEIESTIKRVDEIRQMKSRYETVLSQSVLPADNPNIVALKELLSGFEKMIESYSEVVPVLQNNIEISRKIIGEIAKIISNTSGKIN